MHRCHGHTAFADSVAMLDSDHDVGGDAAGAVAVDGSTLCGTDLDWSVQQGMRTISEDLRM